MGRPGGAPGTAMGCWIEGVDVPGALADGGGEAEGEVLGVGERFEVVDDDGAVGEGGQLIECESGEEEGMASETGGAAGDGVGGAAEGAGDLTMGGAGLEQGGAGRGTTKGEPLFAGSPGRVVLLCCCEVLGNYVEGRIPKALARVTAWVRLWTPSLP